MNSVKINYHGRLGNHILMYLIAQYISEKHNLHFDEKIYDDYFYNFFDVNVISGSQIYKEKITITDENILDFLKKDVIDKSILFDGFFQSPEILKNEEIISKYKKYVKPKSIDGFDIFVHIRLGDIKNRYSLPYEYYDNCIKQINFQNGIITTDSPYDEIVQSLSRKYNLPILFSIPANTIQIGSFCKNLVLSAGTFSYLTAFYSNNSNLYYIDNPTMKKYFNVDPWGPDIFSTFNDKKNSYLYGE